MSSTIIDQYNGDPVYAHLHVLTRDYPLAREMLKTASFENTKLAVEDLPSTAFAWEDERRFPIHTREDALASIFYRSKLGSAVPAHVDAKLATAQAVYQLDISMFSAMKTAAAEPTEYALPDEKRLPLTGSAQIKMAEEVLHRDGMYLTLEKRADAYSRLYTAAKRCNVQLTPLSLKFAGATVSNTHTLRDWLDARTEAAPTLVQKAAYAKLAEATYNMPSNLTNRADLVKVASTIAQIDKQAGLDKFYGKKLPDPLLTVFNTEKVAETTCDVAGMPVPAAALMALPPQIWDQIDAAEIGAVAQSGDPEQFQQVFATLPLDAKMVLREQLGHV